MEQQIEIQQDVINSLRVGDIVLTSKESIENLCRYLLWLLKQKPVKEYLDTIKRNKKLRGSYTE